MFDITSFFILQFHIKHMRMLFLLIIVLIIALIFIGLSLQLYIPTLKKEQGRLLDIRDCEETDIVCYQELASNGYKDIELCNKHPARNYNNSVSNNYINRCYSWIARNTQNPVICESIVPMNSTDEYDMSINIKQYCIAVTNNNPIGCVFEENSDALIGAKYWKYYCLTDLAQLNQNMNLCNDLDAYYKTECYVDFAYTYDDINICNQLSDQEEITKCKFEFGNLKANHIPKWIENIKKFYV